MDTGSARDVQITVDSDIEQKSDVKPHNKQEHAIQKTTTEVREFFYNMIFVIVSTHSLQ